MVAKHQPPTGGYKEKNMVIKKDLFHITGMRTEQEKTDASGNPNYIVATLNYATTGGLCYYWDIRPVYRYTVDGMIMVAEPHGLSVAVPYLRESLVRCGRRTAKQTEKAIRIYEENLVSAITKRLRYRIDQ